MTAPRHQVIRFAECRTMPWKNGGGSTTELAVFPEGAGLDAFDWRISMARVETDGPFSAFPGIDRTLAIMEGDGLSLALGDHGPRRVTLDDCPLSFPADQPASARLLGGPVVDLNVMTRRSAWRHRLAALDLGAGDLVRAQAAVSFIVARDGPVELLTPDGPLALGPRDALRIDGAASWEASATRPAVVLRIDLAPL
jgi:uncharacterized protein